MTGPARKALASAGLATPAACAALSRAELLQRPGIGPKTADAVEAWLATHGLELQPSKEKKAKANARPWTDIWAAEWAKRRPEKYRWGGSGEYWRQAAAALRLAGACGNDADAFRQVCVAFHDSEDRGTWKDRTPTLAKALHQVADLLNAQPAKPALLSGDYLGRHAALSDDERREYKRENEVGRAKAQKARDRAKAANEQPGRL